VDALPAARRWVDGWSKGWAASDARVIADLYAPEVVFRSHPFREPESPGGYAARVFAEGETLEFRFCEPIVTGDRAAVEYWAVLVEDGREVTLAGTTLLRFREDGLAVEHRDYWAVDAGRRPPNF
jgi:SnoaL-like domain